MLFAANMDRIGLHGSLILDVIKMVVYRFSSFRLLQRVASSGIKTLFNLVVILHAMIEISL